MSTAENVRVEDEPGLTIEELIALREAGYQRWLRDRGDVLFPTELDGMSPYEVFYRAFNEGFMACYGEFRDVILASQDEQ